MAGVHRTRRADEFPGCSPAMTISPPSWPSPRAGAATATRRVFAVRRCRRTWERVPAQITNRRRLAKGGKAARRADGDDPGGIGAKHGRAPSPCHGCDVPAAASAPTTATPTPSSTTVTWTSPCARLSWRTRSGASDPDGHLERGRLLAARRLGAVAPGFRQIWSCWTTCVRFASA